VIAVTFALPAESSRFVRRLESREYVPAGETTVVDGKIAARRVAVFHTGVGEAACRRRMSMLLRDRQFNLLISAGFAGALSEQLSVYDVLLAQNFSTVKLDAACAALSDLNTTVGRVTTIARILHSRAERAEIAKQTGAVAADMETEFIARVCAEHALPLLAVRVISDTSARPLPARPQVLFDIAEQRTKLSRLAFHLATHPLALPRFLLFAGQVTRARRALTTALETLLRSDFVAPFIS
jgi:adenosylhomocysteine nucleosidase